MALVVSVLSFQQVTNALFRSKNPEAIGIHDSGRQPFGLVRPVLWSGYMDSNHPPLSGLSPLEGAAPFVPRFPA